MRVLFAVALVVPQVLLAGTDILEKSTGLSAAEVKEKSQVIEVLDLSGPPISDLSFISHVPNVKELKITLGGKVDLSPLAALSLRSLSISGDCEVDFQPLSQLQLKSLALSDLEFTKVKNIALLTSLTKLSINRVKSFNSDELFSLFNVSSLDLTGTPVPSTEGLKNLVNLEQLILKNTELKNLSGVEELAFLEKIDISENPLLTDYSPLEKLKKLSNKVTEQKIHPKALSIYSTLKKFVGQTLTGTKETQTEKAKSVLVRRSTLRKLEQTSQGVRFEELVQIDQKKWKLDAAGNPVGRSADLSREMTTALEVKVAPEPLKDYFGFLLIKAMSPIGGGLNQDDLVGEIYNLESVALEKEGVVELRFRANSVFPWPNTPEEGFTYFKDLLITRFDSSLAKPQMKFTQVSDVIDVTTGKTIKTEEPWVIVQE
jgi:hypothetical protein